MPNAYRTRGDISIPRVIAVEGEGEDRLETTESVLYPAGSYVLPENMTVRDRKRAEAGELDHLLEPADEDEARHMVRSQAGGPDEDRGIFVAEHEAEAHALEAYGHIVVPPEQALEAQSSGAQYAADYQAAVREHGLDHRPVQEHLAQERERVPDEVLAGGETRAGLPYDRGPQDYEGADSENQQERAEQQNVGAGHVASEVAAARPRPGSQQQVRAENPQEGQAGQQQSVQPVQQPQQAGQPTQAAPGQEGQ